MSIAPTGVAGHSGEGRFRSCLIQEETYLLACQRCIELNPVRAGIVSHPAEYYWSSYRTNAQGEVGTRIATERIFSE